MAPAFEEIDYRDPVNLFSLVANHKWSVFFDSASQLQGASHDIQRYSYIGISPSQTFISKNKPFSFAELAEYLNDFPMEKLDHIPPFQGGFAGYLSYDICQYLEKLPKLPLDDMEFPDLALGIYDVVISFDHLMRKAWIVSTGFPEKIANKRLIRAANRIKEIAYLLQHAGQNPSSQKKELLTLNISANFSKKRYLQAIEKAKNYILDGDIFQVNLSQRFEAELPPSYDYFDLYQKLRAIHPAPFAAYFNLGDFVIASVSPERFITLRDRRVETRPIKGTLRRGVGAKEDQIQALALMTSQKDRAENIMIVDLMRNDLSKICEEESVTVEQLCGLESTASVHHLVSVISGELKVGKNAFDLLSAVFPGGSITGCPKIRAMEIIAELEPQRRGPYCGSFCYIGFTGDIDSSILIRTYAINRKKISFHAGGAIVLSSEPEEEYRETLDKAACLFETVNANGYFDR